jgi:hypothetical protein
MIVHAVARAYSFDVPLCAFPVAPVLWRALRVAFPEALAAVLMQNHLHVVSPAVTIDDARLRMAAVLSAVRRTPVGANLRWEPAPRPSVVPDAHHLGRQIRYVALNPARARLASDPLAWLWSTHRDVAGAAVDPWITGERLARALRQPVRGFIGRHHAYVSGDPAVDVRGTPPPSAGTSVRAPWISLEHILAAACAAHRVAPSDVRRRTIARATFLDLARVAGWRDTRALCDVACITRNAVWDRARRGGHPPDAALLCLADERLRAPAASQVAAFAAAMSAEPCAV